MLEFLRAGLRAMHTAEELFMGAGPRPADWWKIEAPPRGPNDETLVYCPDQVRLRAPLPNPARLGTDEDVALHREDRARAETRGRDRQAGGERSARSKPAGISRDSPA